MGATLALEAVAFCNANSIQPVPRCLLMYMALRALDDASGSSERPARRSFLRRSELGLALGRFMPDREPAADAPLAERQKWEADDQAIVRALRALKKAGAIRQVGVGRNGRTVEYEICLGMTQTLSVPLVPTFTVPQGGRSASPGETFTVPPRNNQEQQEQPREQDHRTASAHVRAVDSPGAAA